MIFYSYLHTVDAVMGDRLRNVIEKVGEAIRNEASDSSGVVNDLREKLKIIMNSPIAGAQAEVESLLKRTRDREVHFTTRENDADMLAGADTGASPNDHGGEDEDDDEDDEDHEGCDLEGDVASDNTV